MTALSVKSSKFTSLRTSSDLTLNNSARYVKSGKTNYLAMILRDKKVTVMVISIWIEEMMT